MRGPYRLHKRANGGGAGRGQAGAGVRLTPIPAVRPVPRETRASPKSPRPLERHAECTRANHLEAARSRGPLKRRNRHVHALPPGVLVRHAPRPPRGRALEAPFGESTRHRLPRNVRIAWVPVARHPHQYADARAPAHGLSTRTCSTKGRLGRPFAGDFEARQASGAEHAKWHSLRVPLSRGAGGAASRTPHGAGGRSQDAGIPEPDALRPEAMLPV